jgi:hypothetical protein
MGIFSIQRVRPEMIRVDFMDTLLRRFSAGFGLALAIVILVYNSISPSWWPFIVGDSISALLLLCGALFSSTIRAAGWGFACASFYRAFFLSWGTSGLSWMLVGLTLLFGFSIVGLGFTILLAIRSHNNRVG